MLLNDRLGHGVENAMKISSPNHDSAYSRSDMTIEKSVNLIESIFSEFSGFKKSASLRQKIAKAIDGKSNLEIMAWVSHMMSKKGEQELYALAEDLTNHETFFFRDIIQLECLENFILPELIKRKKKAGSRNLRLWSAACSTGEEAYSLAMIVACFMEKHGYATITASGQVLFRDGWSVTISGSDISRQVLAIARNGIYSDAGLSPFRSFPKQYFRFFDFLGKTEDRLYHQNSRSYSVKKGIKELTSFECHNLNNDSLPPSLKNMDVIFCRNVMIYLDKVPQKKILEVFHKALGKDGYLVLSVVDQMLAADRYLEVRSDRNIIYKRN